jgi:hypothetical protein
MKKTICFLLGLFLVATACNNEQKNVNLNFLPNSSGCGSFLVFKLNDTYDMAIAVSGNREKLNLSTTEQSFDLSSVSNLRVEIEQYQGTSGYCNDVIGGKILDMWTGKSGKVKIRSTQDYTDAEPQIDATYKIDVSIENVSLENSKGEKLSIDFLDFKDVYVGWLPG